MTAAQIRSGIPSNSNFDSIISPPKTTTHLTTPKSSRQQHHLYHFQNPAQDMSLLRTIALRAPRAPLAPAATAKQVRFSTSPLAKKEAGSAVKETIDSVNKTVGDAAVKGIEKGRELACPFLHSLSLRITALTSLLLSLSLSVLHLYSSFPVLSFKSDTRNDH